MRPRVRRAAWRRRARRIPGAIRLVRALRYIFSPAARDVIHLRLFRRDVFQTSARTWPDRYPAIFACLQSWLADRPAPRILSFGCSTGDEVLSLRTRLPHARIVGIDISARNVRIARRRIADDGIAFVRGAWPDAAGRAPYDAILCLAVLQRGALSDHAPDDCSAHLTFDRFEAAIRACDALLAPGGLLALHHSNFRFADTAAAARYTPLLCALPERWDRIRYGPDNRRLAAPHAERAVVFRKDR